MVRPFLFLQFIGRQSLVLHTQLLRLALRLQLSFLHLPTIRWHKRPWIRPASIILITLTLNVRCAPPCFFASCYRLSQFHNSCCTCPLSLALTSGHQAA
jgi:hypothetical protein